MQLPTIGNMRGNPRDNLYELAAFDTDLVTISDDQVRGGLVLSP